MLLDQSFSRIPSYAVEGFLSTAPSTDKDVGTSLGGMTMITGSHSIIYSKKPEADRAFMRDVLKLPLC